MPVFKVFTLTNDCIWGIWKIDEDEMFFQNALGIYAKSENIPAISHQKKRLEWLSSRLLVKVLLVLAKTVFSSRSFTNSLSLAVNKDS